MTDDRTFPAGLNPVGGTGDWDTIFLMIKVTKAVAVPISYVHLIFKSVVRVEANVRVVEKPIFVFPFAKDFQVKFPPLPPGINTPCGFGMADFSFKFELFWLLSKGTLDTVVKNAWPLYSDRGKLLKSMMTVAGLKVNVSAACNFEVTNGAKSPSQSVPVKMNRTFPISVFNTLDRFLLHCGHYSLTRFTDGIRVFFQ